MTDIFFTEDIEMLNKKISILSTTILKLLINKGICTREEFDEYRKIVTIAVEDLAKEEKEKQRKEFANTYPSLSKIFSKED